MVKAGGTHNVDSVPYELNIDLKGKDAQQRLQLRCRFSQELPSKSLLETVHRNKKTKTYSHHLKSHRLVISS